MAMLILKDLEKLLGATSEKTLVTLMHANNEIGNITRPSCRWEICVNYTMPFFIVIRCKQSGIIPSTCAIHRYILLPAPLINFMGQKVSGFYISMKMYASNPLYMEGPGTEHACRYRKHLWYCWFCKSPGISHRKS